MDIRLTDFRRELLKELTGNILPYWTEKMRDPAGGFYGRISGTEELNAEASRGAIMYGRILWTFSAAWRLLRRPEYLAAATEAKEYILRRFVDPEYGGVYWSLAADGTPLDTKKQFYALGFVLYGMSEYARATGDGEARQCALSLYRCIEEHAFDRKRNGYFEAQTRDWREIADMRLSDKDANEKKTMNTHLHILEPYTNLYRIHRDEELRARLENLIDLFLTRIENPESHHLGLFFDEEWAEKSRGVYSYGHDIEATWLLLEAARETGDECLVARVQRHCLRIADAALEGYRPDGSMIYERHADGRLDRERHWWVQAETVIGLFYLYRFYGNGYALDRALQSWEYIKTRLIDRKAGEWFWSILPDGTVNRRDDKAGFWKCPYHNSRMCMEVISRIDEMEAC